MSFYNVYVIAKREFMGYFNAPIGYIVVVAFLVLVNALFFFMNSPLEQDVADVRSLFWFAAVMAAVFMPAVTMRLLAEEFKGKTIELLVSYPVTKLDIVLAKFVAAWALYLVMITLTVPVPWAVGKLGALDWGPIACSYAGLALLGMVYVSIGLLFSATTRNQLEAIALGLVGCMTLSLGLWLVGFYFKGDTAVAISAFSVLTHFDNMTRGVIDSRDLIYFASWSVFLTSLSVYVLDRKAA